MPSWFAKLLELLISTFSSTTLCGAH
jgi:hypothetical protein